MYRSGGPRGAGLTHHPARAGRRQRGSTNGQRPTPADAALPAGRSRRDRGRRIPGRARRGALVRARRQPGSRRTAERRRQTAGHRDGLQRVAGREPETDRGSRGVQPPVRTMRRPRSPASKPTPRQTPRRHPMRRRAPGAKTRARTKTRSPRSKRQSSRQARGAAGRIHEDQRETGREPGRAPNSRPGTARTGSCQWSPTTRRI